MIDFTTIEGLRIEGFEGFATVRALREDRCSTVPEDRGVYMTLTQSGFVPRFLTTSPAGHFKGEDPTVSVPELQENWVRGAIIINIAKAGGPGIVATLKSRIKQYLAFGRGVRAGHRGGRYVWQIEDSERLTICWKPTPNEVPREVKKTLISSFADFYGKFPFANGQR